VSPDLPCRGHDLGDFRRCQIFPQPACPMRRLPGRCPDRKGWLAGSRDAAALLPSCRCHTCRHEVLYVSIRHIRPQPKPPMATGQGVVVETTGTDCSADLSSPWGMFGIRVISSHKHTAKDLGVGKTTACTVTQVCVRSCHTSRRAEAGVRQWSCQAVRQQAVFTGITRNESSVRERPRFWTDLAVAGNYTYPEHTP
jgi:hypothetical protein